MTNEDFTVDAAVIPTTLRDRDQWVCWRTEERDGKATKIPVTPGTGVFASATDPETWDSFEAARDYVEAGKAAGVGFVFTDDDLFVGVDLDDCRDPETGDVDDTARDIIERLDSYTEISPSGTGYHVLITGDLPEGRNRRGSVELYDSARFFTVTGNHVDVTPGWIARRQGALVAIHREYVQDSKSESSTQADQHNNTDDGRAGSAAEVTLADEELLRKARNASNGAKFDRLWNGNTSGYESQSEADMALCCLLAFWTGGDQSQMNQLFQQSGLMREKWDAVHYTDGSTYGEKTTERAVATTFEFYEPASTTESNSAGTTAEILRDGVRDGFGSNKAYLVEKNRVLRARVSTLEASLEAKTERINTLEAALERLETFQATRIEFEMSADQANDSSQTDVCSEVKSVSSSLWTQTKRFFRDVPK
ncbi:hypothetical protein SAMN04487948_12428 [Halogranum amylolyticum]|uniref:NrS-1 polymerase-like HBD domain-containing protein n=1 Tax=Halogranum amylolyticum TaxID=660520 RepID=A0A1H8W665_9EURY|nr:hypothetical protein [Halogranum amylolyticum]SEP23156.1 hypothetical protein SAMN04487948_12428 [Halogranum amylolyticum]